MKIPTLSLIFLLWSLAGAAALARSFRPEIKNAKANPDFLVSIDRHTDHIGTSRYNQTLSEQRAAAVLRTLRDEYRIAANQLTSAGCGPSKPIQTNRPKQVQQKQ